MPAERICRSLEAADEAGRATVLGSDEAFDALYPAPVRALAPRHFTPIAVARRAASLLVTTPGTRVLDVGSGAGKFCLVGALTTPGVYVGVEQRHELVAAARAAAASLAVQAVFHAGEMSRLDWRYFDAFYFYNPFLGDLLRGGQVSVLAERERFFRCVSEAKDRLRQAPDGTRVVTYHGLGSCLPGAYRLLLREPAGDDTLDLWIKAPRRRAGPRPFELAEAA